MTLEREMKATYNNWLAGKFVEHLAKDTKNRRGSGDVFNVNVLRPLGDFGTCDQPTPTSTPEPPNAPPSPKTVCKEKASHGVEEKKTTPQGSLKVLLEDSQWDGGEGYFSDGSDYADYVEQPKQGSMCSKKRRLHRIGSAMDAVESRLSETLLSSPPTSDLQLSSETNTAPPDFSFATIPHSEWDGGDAFFSEGSEMSPTHSSGGSPVERDFENLSLEDKQPPPPSNVQDAPMEEEWEGGDGYFSGSDYGNYADI